MPCIVFFEKPGCATNELQKQLLRSSGMEVKALNLFSQVWTRETLLPYFGERPVVEWFNTSAPAIKYGDLDPSTLDREKALSLILANPLLIHRPLIRVGEQYMVGFDLVKLNAMLPCHGTFPIDNAISLEGCSHGRDSHIGCMPLAEVTP